MAAKPIEIVVYQMNQKPSQKPCQSHPVVLGQAEANTITAMTIPQKLTQFQKKQTHHSQDLVGQPGTNHVSQPEANTIITHKSQK